MASGIGTPVGNSAFVWLDVDEFTYCVLTDAVATSPVANPCARITLLPEKGDVINCRRSQGCHKSDECYPCKNLLEKAIKINDRQFLICGNNALNPRCHLFSHNGTDLPTEQRSKAFYLTKRWFPRTLTEIIMDGADQNSAYVLTLSLEPAPFLNHYSIKGLLSENGGIEEVDKKRDELDLSRKNTYNAIKSFVYKDEENLERAVFLFSTDEDIYESFPINGVSSLSSPKNNSPPVLLKLRCCDPKFPYQDNHSCSYHATSFETADDENFLFGIFRFPFALKSDERLGICKFSKEAITRVITTKKVDEVELEGDFISSKIPGGLSKEDVIIGAKSQELLIHNRSSNFIKVIKLQDQNKALLSTEKKIRSQFAIEASSLVYNLEKTDGLWHMVEVNLCPELPSELSGRVEKCIYCHSETAGYCHYASHKCTVSRSKTRENRTCPDVKNCQQHVVQREVQELEPETPFRKPVSLSPTLPRAGTVFYCEKYSIQELIERITPLPPKSTKTTTVTTTTTTIIRKTTTSTQTSSSIRKTQTTPSSTTTNATESTTTVTEPLSSSALLRSLSNATQTDGIVGNQTTSGSTSTSSSGLEGIQSAELNFILLAAGGVFILIVLANLTFCFISKRKLKKKYSYDLPEKATNEKCLVRSQKTPKTTDQTTQVTPSLPRKPNTPKRQGSSLSSLSPPTVSSIQEKLKDESAGSHNNRRSDYTLSTSSTVDSTAPLLKT
ncbi:Oidioi.mRNA.OKI2018_I69.chr2.g7236.t1.cds [Oikopleura dioica]|uniref:Oidioi.mRNA.OKI2018_I69.chr2.g7236.t1.cds n=1 Tax=Oikopleura dioica TaxID=34765 RepID=A0ABN7T5I5_OIKDI|nr:Oidioi.mRNA.OKI2018_I69.chr2.g7236.t1.cds [Oikopleura dioica]